MEIFILFSFFGAIICAVIGGMIGEKRGDKSAGALLGFLFGPIGLVAAAFISGCNVCPSCRTSNHLEASKCKGCGEKLYDENIMPEYLWKCSYCSYPHAHEDTFCHRCKKARDFGPVEEIDTQIKFQCPTCTQSLSINPDADRGTAFLCPTCNHYIEVAKAFRGY